LFRPLQQLIVCPVNRLQDSGHDGIISTVCLSQCSSSRVEEE
jgi:hypothetical protein